MCGIVLSGVEEEFLVGEMAPTKLGRRRRKIGVAGPWWRTVTGRHEREGHVEEEGRSLLVLAPTHLKTGKGHGEVESLL